jgi:hypothetical protein
MTVKEFKEKNYGKRGTKERDELDARLESYKTTTLPQFSLSLTSQN